MDPAGEEGEQERTDDTTDRDQDAGVVADGLGGLGVHAPVGRVGEVRDEQARGPGVGEVERRHEAGVAEPEQQGALEHLAAEDHLDDVLRLTHGDARCRKLRLVRVAELRADLVVVLECTGGTLLDQVEDRLGQP